MHELSEGACRALLIHINRRPLGARAAREKNLRQLDAHQQDGRGRGLESASFRKAD
jgi:hypothetical protein